MCRDKVVDFHWNAADPWTIVSVSEDGEKTGGGGTLQVNNVFLSDALNSPNLHFHHQSTLKDQICKSAIYASLLHYKNKSNIYLSFI